MNILTESDVPSFGRVSISCRLGEPVELVEIPYRNISVGDGDYGWKAEMLKGKKWISVSISPLRVGIPSVSLDPSKLGTFLQGGIVFREDNREKAIASLYAEMKRLLTEIQSQANASLSSILNT